jgi:ubiquinone/menaquinone biosynthesis C-methylase UbiE
VAKTAESNLQLDVLEALESAHRYNRWIADLTLPFLGDDPLEIGSGIGVSAELWLDSGLPAITTTELDPKSLLRLHERFDNDPRVRITAMNMEGAPDANHSAVVTLNVLEHIEDDSGALRGAARLVRPGGLVVIFVPAFPFAAGRFDRLIGHYRRYTIATISRAFADAEIAVESVRYVNAPGLVAWFLGVRVLGLVPGDGPLLRMWDRLVIPVARKLEARWSPPFGQSVLAIGRTPGLR